MISEREEDKGSTTVPSVIYHYASAETLLKIVDSQAIWATNIYYLNDVTEREHCLAAMKRRLPIFLEQYRPEYGDALAAALDQVGKGIWAAPYVASFSANPDSLPQWRSYCQSGNGVSIGFRTEKLLQSHVTEEPVTEQDFPAPLSRVRSISYLSENDDEMIDRILSDCLSHLDSWHEDQDATDEEERTSVSDDQVLESVVDNWACTVKHSAFANEMEQRLIAPPDLFAGDAIRYRASRTTVIPFIPVRMPTWGKIRSQTQKHSYTFSDYFISEVVVGPAPNPELTTSALNHLFTRKNVLVTIRNSDIPYRDL